MTASSDDASDTTVPVLYELSTGVATITLNQPQRKNALSDDLIDLLGSYLEQAHSDESVRVIVLTNVGNTFCAGADLKSAKPGVAGNAGQDTRTFADVFQLIMHGPKPVVGRIDGHAVGGGVGLAAACDISVMRNDAKIGFTEVRLGVAPALISVVCLPKLNRADATELFLTGERITAERAAQARLINEACEPDALDARVAEFIDMLVRGGPRAIAASKAIINSATAATEDELYAEMAITSRELFASEEAQAGIAAFRSKSPAPWIR